MNHGKTILAQILDGVHPEQFRRCAQRHPMARQTKALSAYDHFAVMVFAQLTYRERQKRRGRKGEAEKEAEKGSML